MIIEIDSRYAIQDIEICETSSDEIISRVTYEFAIGMTQNHLNS